MNNIVKYEQGANVGSLLEIRFVPVEDVADVPLPVNHVIGSDITFQTDKAFYTFYFVQDTGYFKEATADSEQGEILNTEIGGIVPKDREEILDTLAQMGNGRRFIVYAKYASGKIRLAGRIESGLKVKRTQTTDAKVAGRNNNNVVFYAALEEPAPFYLGSISLLPAGCPTMDYLIANSTVVDIKAAMDAVHTEPMTTEFLQICSNNELLNGLLSSQINGLMEWLSPTYYLYGYTNKTPTSDKNVIYKDIAAIFDLVAVVNTITGATENIDFILTQNISMIDFDACFNYAGRVVKVNGSVVSLPHDANMGDTVRISFSKPIPGASGQVSIWCKYKSADMTVIV